MLLPLSLLVSLFLIVAGVVYLVVVARPDRGGAVSIAWALVSAYALLLVVLLSRCPAETAAMKGLYVAILAAYVANAALVAPRAYKDVIVGSGFGRHVPILLVGAALAGQAVLLLRVLTLQRSASGAR